MKDSLFLWFSHLLPKKNLTVVMGKLAQIKTSWFKNCFIRFFIKKYKVNMSEALESHPENFATFNDFFIRHLKPECRPLAQTAIISPADGIISAIGSVQGSQMIQAKGHSYSVNHLLGSETLGALFHNGAYATLYLSPKDYHRVHMPVSGTLEEMIYIPGKLFSVNTRLAALKSELFAKNERVVAIFSTEFGKMAMVLVGATIVGSIATTWLPSISRQKQILHQTYQDASIHLKKGEEMGYFKLGSTVILLFSNEVQNLQWLKSSDSSIKYGEALGTIS